MQVLWQVNISKREPSTSNHFKCVIPFKVQVDFYIPLFEGKIDDDALEKWLSLLKDYCFVKYFSTSVSPSLLKSHPCVKDRWDIYYVQHFKDVPTWTNFFMSSRRNSTTLEKLQWPLCKIWCYVIQDVFLEVILGIIWDAFLDANWDVFLDVNWDANYHPK